MFIFLLLNYYFIYIIGEFHQNRFISNGRGRGKEKYYYSTNRNNE